MPNRSFKEYIANRFYSEFSDAITDYIGDDIDQAELRLFRVQTVGEWEISDIDVQYVSVSDLPGMMIQFDAVVDAEFYVRDANHRTDVDEETHQQFLLRCIGNLAHNLDDIHISTVSLSHTQSKAAAPLSDSLVPIIHNEDLERIAEDFLRRHYPYHSASPISAVYG